MLSNISILSDETSSKSSSRAEQTAQLRSQVFSTIVLNNFKSFGGLHRIRLSGFDAVVGPNGCGKSNMVDAVMFVVGESKTQPLRVHRLFDLIYQGVKSNDDDNSCWVEVLGTQETNDISFRRTISPTGLSTYQWNNQSVTRNEYLENLSKMNINVRSKHFVIMQGLISNISLMDQHRLMHFFEDTCGSIQYKAEHDQLDAELSRVDAKFLSKQLTLNTYRGELRLVKKHEESMRILLQMEEERDKVLMQYALCNINHQSAKLQDLKDRLTVEENVLNQLETEKEQCEAREKMLATANVESDNAFEQSETNINLQKQRVDALNIELYRIELEESTTKQKSMDTGKTLQKLKTKLADDKRALAECQTTLQKARRDLAGAEQQAAEQGEQEIRLSREQLSEYHQLEQEFYRQSTRQSEIHKLAIASADLPFFHARKQHLREQIEQLESYQSAIESKQGDITHWLTCLPETIDAAKKQLDDDTEKAASVAGTLASRGAELEDVKATLAGIECDEMQTMQCKQQQEVLEVLKANCPGMIGRLSDLIHMKDNYERYHFAAVRGLGAHVDSIVVDEMGTAAKCVQVLRARCLGGMETFLPLDTIQFDEPSTTLACIPNGVLLSETFVYDHEIRAAVLHACDNAVVFHEQEHAGCVSQDLGRRVKTIAMNGTLFNRDGLIVGGEHGLQLRPKCYSKTTKTRLATRHSELSETIETCQLEQRKLKLELEEDTAKHMWLLGQLEVARTEFKDHEATLGRIEEDLAPLRRDLQKVTSELDALLIVEGQLETLKQHAETLRTNFFADFCSRTGLINIQQYEQSLLPVQESSDLQSLRQQIGKLSESMGFQELNIQQGTEDLQRFEQLQRNFPGDLREISTKLRAIHAKQLDESRILAELETVHESLIQEKRSRLIERDECKRAISNISQRIETCRHLMLELTASMDTAKSSRHFHFIHSRERLLTLLAADRASEELSQLSDGDDSLPLSEQYILESNIPLRYDQLDQAYLNLDEDGLDEANQAMTDFIARLDSDIADRRRVSVHTTLADAKLKVSTQLEAVCAVLADRNRINARLKEVKRKRGECLSAWLTPVADAIDAIYKELSSSQACAFLEPVNVTEPYLGGVIYCCTVGGKRALPMHYLSGGERSIASLALFYAMLSSRPPPILILDEVDAEMDPRHAEKFMLSCRLRQHAYATMAISHKVNVIACFEGIVGVVKQCGTAQVFHFLNE